MGEACGVSWDGTSSGKLEESAIPDPPDHKSHYLNAADTKSDSSFPVVDGSGSLRAGNVNSAWDMRTRGEGVGEECLRKLDNAFDSDVLPDSAYENSGDNMTIPLTKEADMSGDFGMNLEFSVLPEEALSDGFNRFGVRENEDGSVDVRFKAMEPGERRGIEITEEFLQSVSRKDYSRIPLQLDHSQSQRANVGYIEPDKVKFGGDFLQVQAHVPDTGSSVRNDIIADFTHEPPQITDMSVGFDPRSMEVERGRGDDNPRFVDGRFREFSLTPFPAGYDNGGLTPEFSSAVEQAIIDDECDDCTEETEYSQLLARPHILIEK